MSPPVTKGEVNRAGLLLADAWPAVASADEEFKIVDDYRRSHTDALTKVHVKLREACRSQSGRNFVTSQRLKRMPTILDKIKTAAPKDLASMQDVGGCRAILPDIRSMQCVYADMREKAISALGCQPKDRDYVAAPKAVGYRSMHMVVTCASTNEAGHQIIRPVEIQCRTRHMHQWATAVEAYDLINGFKDRTKRALSTDTAAAKFFAWASAALCKIEGTPPPPETSDDDAVIASNLQTDDARDILQMLEFASDSAVVIAKSKEMVGENGSVLVWLRRRPDNSLVRDEERFRQDDAEKAHARLIEEESSNLNAAAVLIQIQDVEQAKDALLGYYMNTTEFRQNLAVFCSRAAS